MQTSSIFLFGGKIDKSVLFNGKIEFVPSAPILFKFKNICKYSVCIIWRPFDKNIDVLFFHISRLSDKYNIHLHIRNLFDYSIIEDYDEIIIDKNSLIKIFKMLIKSIIKISYCD